LEGLVIRTVVSFLAIAACCTALASPARAQTKTIAAQTLFDEGKKLLKANQISEACRAFENSFKLKMACALAQYDKAILFFRRAGSHPDLVAHCPAHLAGLKRTAKP
jgi:outer membrane protein assembly factor BamD (BamD/ComL family)